MNKITYCKLSKNIQKKLFGFFVLEVAVRSAADVLGIQANTAILFYRKVRQVICWNLVLESHQMLEGSIELDESYFGGVCKGKRGRGAVDKAIVFGLLKCQGKVYTAVVSDTKTKTLMPIMTSKIKPVLGCKKSGGQRPPAVSTCCNQHVL